MAALATTTLAAAVAVSDLAVTLASTSGVLVGTRLYVAGELMAVTRLLGNSRVSVQRGLTGTGVGTHASGATVYLGTGAQFYESDPVGLPPSEPAVTPWINVVAGIIWIVSGSAWVPSASVISAGDIACTSLAATGAVSGATVAAAGACTAASFTATGNVRGATFSVGATAGIDASIVIPDVGTITVAKGIITVFTPA